MVTSLRNSWAFLAYRLPREPSAPRLTLWRALRRLGALQIGDGLVALPQSARNREHLEWLAAGIVEAMGSASVWIARPISAATHDEYAAAMRQQANDEYATVLREAGEPGPTGEVDRRRLVRRLRGQLRRIGARDYFAAPNGAHARAAVERLAELEEVPA